MYALFVLNTLNLLGWAPVFCNYFSNFASTSQHM